MEVLVWVLGVLLLIVLLGIAAVAAAVPVPLAGRLARDAVHARTEGKAAPVIDRVLGLVPSWIYAVAVAVAVLAALLGAQTLRVANLQTDIARTAAAHTKALGDANAKARDTERQWQTAQQEASDNAHAIREINQASARAVDARAARESAAARTDAARLRAGAAGDGLRIPGSDGRAGPATAAEAARERETAFAAAGMYAELYGWAAERLAILARYADEARTAGLECQWSHDVTQEARP